jgi:hypothetical protein
VSCNTDGWNSIEPATRERRFHARAAVRRRYEDHISAVSYVIDGAREIGVVVFCYVWLDLGIRLLGQSAARRSGFMGGPGSVVAAFVGCTQRRSTMVELRASLAWWAGFRNQTQ